MTFGYLCALLIVCVEQLILGHAYDEYSVLAKKLGMTVLHPVPTRMQFLTSRSLRMQKHKFDVTCPDMLFVEPTPVPLNAKTQVWLNCWRS
jgi:hypothetical protein